MQKLLNTIIILLLIAIISVITYLLVFNKFEIERIVLDRDTMTLYVGEKETIGFAVFPEKAEDKTVYWHSNSENVAKVNDDGEVLAIGEGETDIVVRSKNQKVTAISHVKVLIREVDKIELSNYEIMLRKGETKKITAKISPETATYSKIKFQSSDASIATVDDDGLITAINDGNVEIIVRDEREKTEARCNVIVKEADILVDTVSLDKTSVSLNNNEKIQLTATISPSDATNKMLSWTSSDTSIATVDQSGVVTAKKSGTVVITVTTSDGNKIATCKVAVNQNVNASSNIVYKYEGISLKYSIENKKGYYLTHIWMKDPYNQIKKLDSNTANYGKIMTDDELAQAGKKPVRKNVGQMLTSYISNGMIPTSKAVVAFNSSGFFVKGIWEPPSDYYHNRSSSWFVLNEGILTRNRDDEVGSSIIGIDRNGNLKVYGNGKDTKERNNLANIIMADKVKNTFSFGPKLIDNGVSIANNTSTAQRQVICQVDANNYIMYTSIYAASYKQIANILVNNKCQTAFNLDGGGSTSLFYKKAGSTSVTKVRCAESGSCRQVVEGIYFTEK